MSKELFILVIEWNGQKAPTTWYRRLMQVAGLSVRGGRKGASMHELSQRATKHGLIFQEGAIIGSNETLLRSLASILERGFNCKNKDTGEIELIRPEATYFGKISAMEQFYESPEDKAAVDHIEATLGRKGRKPDEMDWTVTCWECGETALQHVIMPITCQECTGTRYYARSGTPFTYADPGGTVYEAWRRMRFATGRFEINKVSASEPPPPYITESSFSDPAEGKVAALLDNPKLTPLVDELNREDAFDILDSVFIAYAHIPIAKRNERRIAAITPYLLAGGEIKKITLATSVPDIFDAVLIDPNNIAAIALKEL